MMNIQFSQLAPDANIKWGYALSSIPELPETWEDVEDRINLDPHKPRRNDVLVAEITGVGQHTRIDLRDWSKSRLMEGDLVGLAISPRYATNNFQAVLPPSLAEAQFVCSGGVCGKVIGAPSGHAPPTRLRVLGYLTDGNGRRVNLRDLAPKPVVPIQEDTDIIAIVGSSMDSGKTTTAASLVNGLRREGRRVGAAKITGTASVGDPLFFRAAGANPVVDFTNAGYASTANLSPDELWGIFEVLLSLLAKGQSDTFVLEIADGVTQEDTSALLDHFARTDLLSGLLYTCSDSLGVASGVELLRRRQLPVLAISGKVTSTPLSIREAQKETDVPVLAPNDLRDPLIAVRLQLRERIPNKRRVFI
jgi:hypothetical protein